MINHKNSVYAHGVTKPDVSSFRGPNIASIIWILICIKIIGLDVSKTGIIDYAIWGFSCFIFLLKINQRKTEDFLAILIPFLFLLLLQMIGLLQIATSFSFRNMVATICICFFIIDLSFLTFYIQKRYFNVFYFFALGAVLISALSGVEIGNTLPGCIIFLSFAFLISKGMKNQPERERKPTFGNSFLFLLVNLATVSCIMYISWVSDARSALFTSIIIVSTFFLLRKVKPKERVLNKFFWALVISVFLVTIIYMNAHTFSWYSTLNNLSIYAFNKNIDSSRPFLWKISVESLKWWQVIIGSGTGRLPDIVRYAEASFHNSYIQLLMQNGILGLLCLVTILYLLWKKLTRHAEDRVIQLVLAVFVGILIYNCFETTLLQNKAFMGMIEWLAISMGIIRSRQLDTN